MADLEITATPTYADYCETYGKQQRRLVLGQILNFLVVCGAWLAGYYIDDHRNFFVLIVSILYIIGFTALLFMIVKKNYEGTGQWREQYQIRLAEDGATFTTPCSTTTFPWTSVSSYTEGPRLFRMMLENGATFFIPKPIDAPRLELLRQTINRHVVPRTRAFEVVTNI